MLEQEAVDYIVCLLPHAIMLDTVSSTVKPTAERAEQVCAVIEVPIHDEKAENKSLKKRFHAHNIGWNHRFFKQLKGFEQRAIYTPCVEFLHYS